MSFLHRQFCDCPDYKSHFHQWPTPPTTPAADGPADPDTGESGSIEVGEDVGDGTLVEAGNLDDGGTATGGSR